MRFARALGPCVVLGALAFAGACGGAKVKANTELRDDDLTTGKDDYSGPAASSSAAPPPSAPVDSTPPPQQVAMDSGPTCPVHCAIATPRHRVLAPDEEERLRAAFAPTIGGLHSCMNSERYEGRWVRPPALTIRFAPSGDLLDVGVDTTGWANDSCFQAVVRGPSTGPDVRLEGPATVRCGERCERPHVRTRTKK
jgi:hypothetical protein